MVARMGCREVSLILENTAGILAADLQVLFGFYIKYTKA